MNITVFGGNTGIGFLKDLRLKVFLKNDTAGQALKTFFPSSFSTENGESVYEQDVSVASGSSVPLISKIQLVSPTLNIVIFALAGLLALLLAFVIARLSK